MKGVSETVTPSQKWGCSLRGNVRAILLAVLLGAGLGSVYAADPSMLPQGHETLLSFEAALFDQDVEKTVVTFRFTLPIFERVDAKERWHLETSAGTGMATVLLADGTTDQVPLKVRINRYNKGEPLTIRPNGSRLWSMRGDLYLHAEGHPSVEMELGADVAIPVVRLAETPPPVLPRAAGKNERAYIVQMMEKLMLAGSGGGLIYGLQTPLWGRLPTTLPHIGFIRLTGGSAQPARKSLLNGHWKFSLCNH